MDLSAEFQLARMSLVIIVEENDLTFNVTSSTFSAFTVDELQTMFVAFGLVSDNGTISAAKIPKQNGIQHVRTVPYHPSL